jgi:hypothetical protein
MLPTRVLSRSSIETVTQEYKMSNQNLYKVIVKDPDSGDIYEVPFKTISLTEELNKESTASFGFSWEQVKEIADAYETTILGIFSTGFREIYIERINSSAVFTKIFWGAIMDMEVRPSEDGKIDFTIKATSWFGLLGRRYVGFPSEIFPATDAGEIAWTLIDDSQNSDSPYSELGITEGSIDTSVNRERTYRFDNIKDQIIALSNNNLEDGFDFEIDNTKAFNVYYPEKGAVLPNVVFDNTRTLASWSYHRPLLSSLTNRVYVRGDGQGDAIKFSQRDSSNGNKDTYTLLETVLPAEAGVVVDATLEAKGDRYLAVHEVPIDEFTAEHYDDEDNYYSWFDYNLGDTVKVNILEIGFINEPKRVIRRELKVEEDKGIGYITANFDLMR